MEKIYLNEFLDKLFKMIETSKTNEQIENCINYINLYKIKLNNIINNDLFRETTINYLDDIIKNIKK